MEHNNDDQTRVVTNIAAQLKIGQNAVQDIILTLGYQDVVAIELPIC
jgi:hypothetical protein